MLNRGPGDPRRFAYVEGVSEMNDVIPIAESASRAITNGQLAQETHAVPHRVLLGASKADFVRPTAPRPARSRPTCPADRAREPRRQGGAVRRVRPVQLRDDGQPVRRAGVGVTGMPIEYFGLQHAERAVR
jgi:hypothetical protein